VAYNATLAEALSMAPQLGTLTDGATPTKPSLTQGTTIWARAYDEVRLAFRRGRMADTVGASSMAEGLAQSAEMLLASGRAMLAKGSLSKEAAATARDLIAEARTVMELIATGSRELVTEGATAKAASPTRFVRSHQIDDADPDFDRTPGTGDLPYAESDPWPHDGDAL